MIMNRNYLSSNASLISNNVKNRINFFEENDQISTAGSNITNSTYHLQNSYDNHFDNINSNLSSLNLNSNNVPPQSSSSSYNETVQKHTHTSSNSDFAKQVQFHQKLQLFSDSYSNSLNSTPPQNRYFFPNLNRQKSENLFASNGLQPGSFIIRYASFSDFNSPQFALSVVCNDESIRHFKIVLSRSPYPSSFWMLETENTINQTETFSDEHDSLFTGIDSLIEYYRKNSITDTETGKIILVKTLPNGEPLSLNLRSKTNLESPLHKPWEYTIQEYVQIFRSQNQDDIYKLICDNITMRNKDGFTPLQICAIHKYIHHLEALLVESDMAKIDDVDSDGVTALHHVCQNGMDDICEVLIDKFSASPLLKQRKTGWTCAHEASYQGHVNILEVLLQHKVPMKEL